LSLLSGWWHDTRLQVPDLHGRYTSHLPPSLQTRTIGATPPSTVTHSQLCLSACPVTLLSCRLTSLQPVKPSWPYSTQQPHLHKVALSAIAVAYQQRYESTGNTGTPLTTVRSPSTSSGFTVQYTLCKVGLAIRYPVRSRYARQLLGLSSPTDAPLAICADTS